MKQEKANSVWGQENTLVIANTLFQQYKRRPYTWTSLDGQHQNQTDYILCSQRWRSKNKTGSWLWLDHELLIAKFRLKFKKVGKTIRPFRYDLNKISNDYTVEVRNRFKGLYLIEYLMNYGQRSWHFKGDREQDHPQEKEMQKQKTVVWEALQIAVKEGKPKPKEKRKDISIWMQSSKE